MPTCAGSSDYGCFRGKAFGLILSLALIFSPVPTCAESFWERLGASFGKAATAPEVWIPLAAAGIAYATGIDEPLTRWVSDKTPLFGSQEAAIRWSDYFADATVFTQYVTAASVPGNGEPGNEFQTKGSFILGGIAANTATNAATGGLKGLTQRERPDNSGRNSFPSGHASLASVNSTLTSGYLKVVPWPKNARNIIGTGMTVLTAGTAWARIEADKHFLSDVLAGAALGNFIGIVTINLLPTVGNGISITSAAAVPVICYTLTF